MDEKKYGIDRDYAHERAKQLIPEDFFWSSFDELAPFGSDEGDMALAEYRDWRKQYAKVPTIECLKWVVESVGEMNFEDYNNSILDLLKIKEAIANEDFDDRHFIYTLDISIIATGFAQLVDEGVIEVANKPVIQLAIDRLKIWATASVDWEHAGQYIENLTVLERVLKVA